jgi:hypothetical protein
MSMHLESIISLDHQPVWAYFLTEPQLQKDRSIAMKGLLSLPFSNPIIVLFHLDNFFGFHANSEKLCYDNTGS